jgi:hypothetical protein
MNARLHGFSEDAAHRSHMVSRGIVIRGFPDKSGNFYALPR